MEQLINTIPFRRQAPEDTETELRQLQNCLETVRRELDRAYTAFNMADDADLVESCVFEINALQARYNYLFKQAKYLETAT